MKRYDRCKDKVVNSSTTARSTSFENFTPKED